jgi:hypothetical protein
MKGTGDEKVVETTGTVKIRYERRHEDGKLQEPGVPRQNVNSNYQIKRSTESRSTHRNL